VKLDSPSLLKDRKANKGWNSDDGYETLDGAIGVVTRVFDDSSQTVTQLVKASKQGSVLIYAIMDVADAVIASLVAS
jgi:hypothetical protein